MTKRSWKVAAIAIVVIVMAAVYVSLVFSGRIPFADVCSKGEYGPPDNCASHDIVSALILRCFVFADEHNGLVAAFAGLAVAFFTGTLWFVTDKGIDLARDEFNATHRPEIIVHSVEAIWGIIKDAEGMKFKTVGARITYFNKGTVPAKDVEIRALILGWPERLELEQSIVAPILDCPTEPILAGKPYTFDVKSQITANKADGDKIDDPAGGTIQKSEIKVYCFGTISYADSAGTMRQTGFRWRWKTPFSWIRETGNSYHFEY